MTPALPSPCWLCGHVDGVREGSAWVCGWCGWPHADSPDWELPRPVVEVVYYVRYDRRVKIGTSRRPRQRLASIRHDELLAFERGGRSLEQQRHRDFAALREGGEWFTLTGDLAGHIAVLREEGDPWRLHARWLSAAWQGHDV
ncbi:GIY-YIG nuclease family protein [Microbacterium hydrocarbonoxydans]|uniref:GIY-YIG nuclease family protein n=1 Tax=Microbacterium hydrocarbonoxydans TaxID=273678 RepID=UPI0013DBDFCE|nr:GIY-YIG nuclease family protein [Microbacterium hydrocarbonoxydans]